MIEIQGPAEIVIMTGAFEAGRRMAAHVIEDLGWYVVDNLPLAMLPIPVDRVRMTEWLAVVVDMRSREEFKQFSIAFAEVKVRGYCVTVLFLEASDDMAVQHQESSRRSLLLQHGGRLFDGVMRERQFLADLRVSADTAVDASWFSTRQLIQCVFNHLGTGATGNLSAALMFSGFKNRLPVDADIVFDVHSLPNPYWVPELRPKTELSPDVASYMLSQDATQEFQGCMLGIIKVAAPGHLVGGKRQVTVTTGYTGGKHRSTSMTEELVARLCGRGYGVSMSHRDLGKE